MNNSFRSAQRSFDNELPEPERRYVCRMCGEVRFETEMSEKNVNVCAGCDEVEAKPTPSTLSERILSSEFEVEARRLNVSRETLATALIEDLINESIKDAVSNLQPHCDCL